MTVTTTLNAIRKFNPCKDGWEKLLANLGKTRADDDPLEMVRILESNGLDDALWCLRSLGPEHHKLIVSLACDFAERSLKFVREGELRPAECLRITRLWVEGHTTTEEVRRAADAAHAAAYAANATSAAYAAYAVTIAADAAHAAANVTNATSATSAAANAASAASAAAYAAANATSATSAANDAERAWQAEWFVEVMRTN